MIGHADGNVLDTLATLIEMIGQAREEMEEKQARPWEANEAAARWLEFEIGPVADRFMTALQTAVRERREKDPTVKLTEKQLQCLKTLTHVARGATVESLARKGLVEHTSLGWRLTPEGRDLLSKGRP